MSLSSKRHTQFDMLALAGTTSPDPSPEAAQSQHLGSTSQQKTLNKKRARPSEEDKPESVSETSKTSELDRVKLIKRVLLKAVKDSPWRHYDKIYDLKLAGPVQVAVRKADPGELVHVRSFTDPGAERALHSFQHIHHRNIVSALEAFTTDDGLYVVLEAMPISLERIVVCPAYPDERQLAAILGQLLNGIAYLEAEKYVHGSLSCSNILLSTDGNLKIASQESCRVMSQPKGERHDLRSLSTIVMELMQKYVKDDGAIGIDDLHRWHSGSDAVGFLSATTSAVSAAELLKHPLLIRPWNKRSLIGLISLAQVCVRGHYKYIPSQESLE